MRKLKILISDHTKQGDRDYSDLGTDCTTENIERVHINRIIKKRFDETREKKSLT